MFKFVINNNDPKVLIITPLREQNTISNYTIDSVIGTSVPIHWISYSSDQNPYKNFNDALKYYGRFYSIPKYIIKVDNDIKANNDMIGSMVKTLDSSDNSIAYTYCDFKFEGIINMSFKAISFDIGKLLKNNYISSISMMKSDILKQIGGVETDDKYFRLLDWVLWLKFLKNGYKGTPTINTSFVAYSGKDDVSSRSYHDYKTKYKNVYDDFIKSMLLE